MKNFYILHPDGNPFGPFDWKLVRFLYALGMIEGYYINEEGSEIVTFPNENPKFLKQPTSTGHYVELDNQSGFTQLQIEIFNQIGLPPLTGKGHRYTGNKILSMLIEDGRFHIEPKLLWRAKKESSFGWKDDPATENQLSTLISMGIRPKDGLSKGEASCLIGSPATDAQRLRLEFYGVGHLQNITKSEASDLIDEYKSLFPESEDEYQASKLTIPIPTKKSLVSKLLNKFHFN